MSSRLPMNPLPQSQPGCARISHTQNSTSLSYLWHLPGPTASSRAAKFIPLWSCFLPVLVRWTSLSPQIPGMAQCNRKVGRKSSRRNVMGTTLTESFVSQIKGWDCSWGVYSVLPCELFATLHPALCSRPSVFSCFFHFWPPEHCLCWETWGGSTTVTLIYST